nr:MAG TPA: hypothetical protein [Caudoviricetes sp.]
MRESVGDFFMPVPQGPLFGYNRWEVIPVYVNQLFHCA